MGAGKGRARRAQSAAAKQEIGPQAVTLADGTKEWRLKGKLHRLDGPAKEYSSGSKEWYRHGQKHREAGPAVEYADGDYEWWLNGKRHREDGPAVMMADFAKEWWLDGKEVDQRTVEGAAMLKRLEKAELGALEKVTF